MHNICRRDAQDYYNVDERRISRLAFERPEDFSDEDTDSDEEDNSEDSRSGKMIRDQLCQEFSHN